MDGERSLAIFFWNDYHGSSSWGNVTINEIWMYIKNKVHTTEMQMRKRQTVLYWIVYVCRRRILWQCCAWLKHWWDSLTDDIVLLHIINIDINIALTLIDKTLNILLSQPYKLIQYKVLLGKVDFQWN